MAASLFLVLAAPVRAQVRLPGVVPVVQAPVAAPTLPVLPAGSLQPMALPAPVLGPSRALLSPSPAPSPEPSAALQEIARRFDGLAPVDRAAVLAGLEESAKSGPRDGPVRQTLQALLLRDELEAIEPRLRGVPVTPGRRDAVLALTRFRDIRWHHHFTDEVQPVPDGITQPDNRIALHVRGSWRRLPSFTAHFRVLFSHEYTHRLQNEGEVTRSWGVEAPAVATELLRAVELLGLEALRAGAVRFIGAGVLDAFERGRDWVRQGASGREDGFYGRGNLAGAAFEIAARTGRWADAWEFHRRVSAGAAPRDAARLLLGR